MKKILNSFIVDDGTKRVRVALIQYSTNSRLIRHLYLVGKYPTPFLTKFFAKRFYTKLKKGYMSAKGYTPSQLRYSVYEEL